MRFDDLQENAIDDILGRLPTRDAVRTSVLARSWRHRWKRIPDLDLSFVPLAAVDRTLSLHSAPVRHFKFKIARSESGFPPPNFVPAFSALVRRSSATLRSIDITSWISVRLCSFALSCPRLTLIRLASSAIEKLLCNADFTNRPIFPDLRTLDLNDVTFAHDPVELGSTGRISMQMYIPPCPKLETLALEPRRSVRCDTNTIGSDFPLLAHLKLSRCYLVIVPFPLVSLRVILLFNVVVNGKLSVLFSSCPSLEMLSLIMVNLISETHLYVDAPNLRWLKLVKVWQKGNRLNDFIIASSPVLESVSIDLEVVAGGVSDEGADDGCNLMKVLGGLPHVKKLAICDDTIEFLLGGLIPEKFPTSLEHLTHLSMDVDFSRIRDTAVALCILRRAPNLQHVEFKSRFCRFYVVDAPGDRERFWKAREHMDPFNNLQTVRITLRVDDAEELEFILKAIQFVLSKAQVLKTMMIELAHDGFTEVVMKRILEFLKDSNQVQLKASNQVQLKASNQVQIVFPRQD